MAAINAPTGTLESRKLSSRFDGWLLLSALILLVAGLMAIFSEGHGRGDYGNFQRQAINTAIGLIPFSLMYFVSPNFWRRTYKLWYVVMLGLLLATLVLGKDAKGAQRWIDIGPIQFQPSEFAKLLSVLTLSSWYSMRQANVHKVSTFFGGMAHIGLPVALIFKQPHLGAALVVIAMWFSVALIAGTPLRFFGTALAAFAGLAILVVAVKPVSNLVLKDYQRERIQGLLSKQKDRKGDNWQTDRAEIAFGVGGVMGSGYLKGDQKKNGFIPEQRNDFVFTVVGEEGGLIGGTLVLLAYGFFFYRVFLAMLNAGDPYLRCVATGIFTILGFHTFVNIAMVLQIVPVVGLWLPFLSSGGTAIWLCMACVGLLLNIRRREKPLLFD
ncbi:rod shape-determining protein RodA [bacterium]|nr:MAG: rod shape-determining protein RodA [bacterium]